MQDLKLVDQTRGILTWVTDNVPGNFHKEVGYATVRRPMLPGHCASASAHHPQLINDDRDEQSHVWTCLGTTLLLRLQKINFDMRQQNLQHTENFQGFPRRYCGFAVQSVKSVMSSWSRYPESG